MKKNLILLIVLVVIGAFFYWDRGREEQQKEQEEKEKQLFTIEQDDVNEITVVKGESTFKAVKDGERWKLVQPFETDGDKSNWNSIASSYTTGKLQRIAVENADDLTPFGLDAPAIAVSLAGVGGATKSTLLFGDETPASGKYFSMVDGSSDVLTVYSSLYNLADKELYDFRDKTIVDMETGEVQKIEIANSGANMTLERQGENEWIIASPVKAKANEAQIRDMINNVKNGQIKQFIEETPESYVAYGLVDPATKLVFWTGEANNQSSWAARALLIGGTTAADQLYAKLDGQKNVFAVAPSDFNKVPPNADSLRLKKISNLRSWEISKVKLSSGGAVIAEASKDLGDWFLLQPESGKANFSSVSQLVSGIADMEAATFIQGTTDEYGLGQPDITIEISKTDTSSNEIITEAIDLVKQQGDEPQYYYGARSNPVEIYGLIIEDVDSILDKAKSVRIEPEPTPVPLDETADEGDGSEK